MLVLANLCLVMLVQLSGRRALRMRNRLDSVPIILRVAIGGIAFILPLIPHLVISMVAMHEGQIIGAWGAFGLAGLLIYFLVLLLCALYVLSLGRMKRLDVQSELHGTRSDPLRELGQGLLRSLSNPDTKFVGIGSRDADTSPSSSLISTHPAP